ncbi:MAG: fumarylacetoacetate hydrolase family protein [Oscillospiraceae bacterium]|nr:fumarylacetoacetate hydrolase family protein [Oscillospiraceae bacterium]
MDKSKMDKSKIEAFALELFEAERARRAVPPITEREPAFGADDAYAVQMVNIARASAMGHTVSGKKIGLTSPAIQRQLGVDEPDYGHLFAAMNCPGGGVDTAALIQPKIEAELAFVLKKDLTGGNVTPADVEDATDYVVAAFEVVDSRIADWRLTLPDTVADNASSGRYVLGRDKVYINGVDFKSVSMKLFKIIDGRAELVSEGLGSAVLGDPKVSVAWLANKLHHYGVALKAGEVVLSGAFSAAPAARKGDLFRAYFTSIGSVEARFE